MRLIVFLTAVALLGSAGPVRADKVGPPSTYKVTSADGKYVFVMLSPLPAEQELARYNEDHQKVVKAIRDAYARSGLYRNDGSKDPLWTVDWYGRVVWIASDGVHVVRHGEPADLEEARQQKPRSITANDLKQEAISIFARGKLLRRFSIGELVDDPKRLTMSVSHFMWLKQARLIDDKKQLEVTTHDGNRILIDLPTAKILEKTKAAQ